MGKRRSPDDMTADRRRLPDEVITPELIASLLADGDDDLAAWALGQALEARPRAVVFDELVQPALRLVGANWESGRWTIAEEHLASRALDEALARIRPATTLEARIGPVVVLAAPAGEQHAAGLVCLAQVLEEDGWKVENLGPNLPRQDLVRFLSNRTVHLVALSISRAASLPALRRTIDAIRRAGLPEGVLPIIVGGGGTAELDLPVDRAHVFGTSIVEAQRFAREVARRASRPTE
jgi:methanogenic corrinoid protein MtbC1